MKKYGYCEILSNENLASGIFDMRIFAPEIAETARPGQFLNFFIEGGDALLPRPLSICEIDREKGYLRIVYRTAGKGTLSLSGLKSGEKVKILGSLGNGFDLSEGNIAVIGGGIGIPPLLGLVREIKSLNPHAKITAFLGYRDKETFLSEDFSKLGAIINIATDDGCLGFHGNAAELIKSHGDNFSAAYACGPTPMLKALSDWAKSQQFSLYISMEERMACGVGACIGCAVKVRGKEGYIYKKVCKDGPVFLSGDILFE